MHIGIDQIDILCSYLDEVGERLTAEGVPHTTAVGTLDNVGAILAAAAMAGFPDFEEHLWLGSLLETFYLMRHERRAMGLVAVAQTLQGIEEVSIVSIYQVVAGSTCEVCLGKGITEFESISCRDNCRLHSTCCGTSAVQ